MPNLTPFDPGLRNLLTQLGKDMIKITGDWSAPVLACLPLADSATRGHKAVHLALDPFADCALPDIPLELADLCDALPEGGRLVMLLPALEAHLSSLAAGFWQGVADNRLNEAAEAVSTASAPYQAQPLGLVADEDGSTTKLWLAEEAEAMIRLARPDAQVTRFRYLLHMAPEGGRAAACDTWLWGFEIRPRAALALPGEGMVRGALARVIDEGAAIPDWLGDQGTAAWRTRLAAILPNAHAAVAFDFWGYERWVSGGYVQHIVHLAATREDGSVEYACGSASDLFQAGCLAVWECLERRLAAQADSFTRPGLPYRDHGSARVPLQRWSRIAPHRAEVLEALPLDVVRATCLLSGDEVTAPAALFRYSATGETAPELRGYSSIGLALHPERDMAVFSALSEVMERHAFRLLADGEVLARPVVLDVPELAALADDMAVQGQTIRFFDIRGVLPLPVILCRLDNAPSSQFPHPFGLGIGTGFDLGQALRKALREAVQTNFLRSRVVFDQATPPLDAGSAWTPDDRVAFWARADAPTFLPEVADGVSFNALRDETAQAADAPPEVVLNWLRAQNVGAFAVYMGGCPLADEKVSVWRVVCPELRVLSRYEPRDKVSVPHPFV